MDDDQTPLKPRSGRGSRGPTRLKRIALRRVACEKTRVDIDVNTEVAFGPKADEFMSYLGVVSRETWRLFRESRENEAWMVSVVTFLFI